MCTLSAIILALSGLGPILNGLVAQFSCLATFHGKYKGYKGRIVKTESRTRLKFSC